MNACRKVEVDDVLGQSVSLIKEVLTLLTTNDGAAPHHVQPQLQPAQLAVAPAGHEDAGSVGYGRFAARFYAERAARARFFDGDLFGEPAWDIMLDLYEQMHHDRQVSITSACIAAGVPPSTAQRWINIMVDRGLLVRVNDPVDKRRAYVELSPAALTKMQRYFETIDQDRRLR